MGLMGRAALMVGNIGEARDVAHAKAWIIGSSPVMTVLGILANTFTGSFVQPDNRELGHRLPISKVVMRTAPHSSDCRPVISALPFQRSSALRVS